MKKQIQSAIQDIKNGKMVIVIDDENRENEGDLIMSAEKVTTEAINFMIKKGGGLICMPIKESLAKKLQFNLMVEDLANTESTKCKFTISVDAKKETTTGISAADRANTIQKIINEKSIPSDFNKPGHIFPLVGEKGGVLVRAGHTEAAIDLAKLAGHSPAGVICEILNEDGTMARKKDLEKIAQDNNLNIISIANLIKYRLEHDSLIRKGAEANLPTKYGDFRIHIYQDILNNEEHLALVKGKIDITKATLVRVHSECLTGDVFGSARCDCGSQLDKAMQTISDNQSGIVLYMRQEGRGIGLLNKLKAYHLQDQGMDTVEANEALGFRPDLRSYGIGAQILKDLGIKKINLLTNNPKKVIGLEGYGLEINKQVSLQTTITKCNRAYLETKKKKMGHELDI